MDIRTALLQLRSELNMRQVDLAAELGISTITINRWETGKNKPGRAMSLAIIAVAANKKASTTCRECLKSALLQSGTEPCMDDLRFARIDQINELVNDSSNAVLVSDVKTHEILYANQKMGLVAGRPLKQASTKKCYEFLFGKKHPCDFCKVNAFSEGEFITGEYESEKTGRYYISRGKITNWNGKKAHMLE